MPGEFAVFDRWTGDVVRSGLSRREARNLARSTTGYYTNEWQRRSILHGNTSEPNGSRFPSREYYRVGYKGEDPIADKARPMASLAGVRVALGRIGRPEVVISAQIHTDEVHWTHTRRVVQQAVEWIDQHPGATPAQFVRWCLGRIAPGRRTIEDWYENMAQEFPVYSFVLFVPWA